MTIRRSCKVIIIMIKYIRDSNEKNINKNNKKISTNTIQIS